MKTIIKLIIRFFILIRNFLFGKKVKESVKLENTSVPMVKILNQPVIPKHNNRRITRGRFVQYVNMGEGRTRPIFYGAKNNYYKKQEEIYSDSNRT
jgi:hypothetical protein